MIPYSQLTAKQKAAVAEAFSGSAKTLEQYSYKIDTDGAVGGRMKTRVAGAVTEPEAAPKPAQTPANDTPVEANRIVLVQALKLVPSPLNPRRRYDAESLKSLSENIKAIGIVHALLVRPYASATPACYEVIAGHRRLRAAQMAGLDEGRLIPHPHRVMSKKTRRQRAVQAASIASPQQIASPSTWSGSGYDGANWSSRRGYVYFPTLDTRQEIPRWTRLEMLRRARYLVRNVGYAKRCTRGAALMIGSLSPRSLTDAREWNDLAEAAWARRACRPLTFDRSGKFGVDAYQTIVTTSRFTDGDFLSVLTEDPFTQGAMVASYEGHQVGNPLVDQVDLAWRDGIHVLNDRAAECSIIDPMDPTIFTKIPARDYILNADYLSIGHSRGVTALHHAINNLLDVTEIRSDVKLGIKLGNRIGYYIAKNAMNDVPKGPRGMGGPIKADKTETGEPILIENVYRGGKVLQLNPGEEIKQLLDQRPHPNSREFLEDLNRDIAWGMGLSPDVLWNIAKLGGASVRYVLADAQVWIESQQQLLVDQFLHRFWVYFISKEIKAGRLPECPDPEWWWKVAWQPPAKLTVDISRDGRLSIDLHRAGMLSLQRWYGSQGLDYEHELRQQVREYALKIKICEEIGQEFKMQIDPDKVFPPAPGSPVPSNLLAQNENDFNAAENVQRITDIHELVKQIHSHAA